MSLASAGGLGYAGSKARELGGNVGRLSLIVARLAGAAALGLAAPAVAQDVVPSTNRPAERAADVIPYTINPGDEIEVYVWGEERLQRTVRVLPDGTMAMPLIGQLIAQGLLPEQLEAAITRRLAGQYRGAVPQVTVSVRNPAGLQFSVVGKVKGPGSFTPGRYVNLLEALSLAGGPAEFANLDNVAIIRKTATGTVTVRARLSGVFKNGSPGSGADAIPRVLSGDTIVVP